MAAVRVAIVMGSKSDEEVAQKAAEVLKEFGIAHDIHVISAHRNPNRIHKFVRNAERDGYTCIIAMAGLAAHLPGVVASLTVLPVIGVPIDSGPLRGQDALYSIVQMPPGIAVATVGIGNAKNAGLLAAQICGAADPAIRERMKKYREQFGDDPN
jgi:5-(carboxyamino)imidazole ribonucleotide mutase